MWRVIRVIILARCAVGFVAVAPVRHDLAVHGVAEIFAGTAFAAAATAVAVTSLKKKAPAEVDVPPPVLELAVEEPVEEPVEEEPVEEPVEEEPVIKPLVITKAAWSGDAFRAGEWPSAPVVFKSKRISVALPRAAWSGDIFSTPARPKAPPTAAELAKAEMMRTIAGLSIQRSPAPVMERVAWSGSIFDVSTRKVPVKPSFLRRTFARIRRLLPKRRKAEAASAV